MDDSFFFHPAVRRKHVSLDNFYIKRCYFIWKFLFLIYKLKSLKPRNFMYKQSCSSSIKEPFHLPFPHTLFSRTHSAFYAIRLWTVPRASSLHNPSCEGGIRMPETSFQTFFSATPLFFSLLKTMGNKIPHWCMWQKIGGPRSSWGDTTWLWDRLR